MPSKKNKNDWVRRNVIVVFKRTQMLVALLGDKFIIMEEGEYCAPNIAIGYVLASMEVKFALEDWWDDLRLRSTDGKIHVM